MGIMEKVRGLAVFGIGQFSSYIDILKDKLRIIGFANKRSGLYTKLGEMTYKSVKEGSLSHDGDGFGGLIEEIELTGSEITDAENAINDKKTKSKSTRDEYWVNVEKSSENHPPSTDDGQESPPAAPEEPGKPQEAEKTG